MKNIAKTGTRHFTFGWLPLGYLLVATSAPTAHANTRDGDIRSSLRRFDESPAKFMRTAPEKTIIGSSIPYTPALGSNISKYALINDAMDRLENSAPPPVGPISGNEGMFNLTAPVEAHDRAEDLVDELKWSTLEQMDHANLLSSQLDEQPWSDTYWPIAKGVIAWRYGDPGYPASADWKVNSDYLLDPANSCSVDQLSPAEKYDLLVGDSRKTMTHAMLKDGQHYYMSYGSVESWMGICHGWAPASYMARRPEKTVQALAADGISKIRFFPSDLKALTSLLWANGQFGNRFIGLRCEDKNPPRDEHGRSLDPACYGENPATWHLSVVNQIGVSRRSFVMDALHDTEIWNQPIYGYKYSYFNPQTKEPASSLQNAEVSLAEFTSDKFRKYRSATAASVVGIAMDLTYVAENNPSTAHTDSPANDALITVHYLYDLELGANRQIVGGEWYSNAHPGFLWTPVPGARAVTLGDRLLANAGSTQDWNGSTAIPASWSPAIRRSSERGQPVGKIVETLGILEIMQ